MNEFYASGLTNISTHTLTWSVTFSLLAVIFPNVYFNSHAHVERDIRVPVTYSARSYFNSHAHVERDRITTDEDALQKAFQLTRSRGA